MLLGDDQTASRSPIFSFPVLTLHEAPAELQLQAHPLITSWRRALMTLLGRGVHHHDS